MGILIAILVSAIFGIICAMIARKKNRSEAGWFAAGFFLAPIALIIIALLKPKRRLEHG
jgi:predicted membrane channel-forming protein YqfA (hemolysin III family)